MQLGPHRIEQGFRENRRAKVTHGQRVKRIMLRRQGIAMAGFDGQIIVQPLTHFGALFAFDGGQLRVIIRRQIPREVAMRILHAVPIGGQMLRTATQFYRAD